MYFCPDLVKKIQNNSGFCLPIDVFLLWRVQTDLKSDGDGKKTVEKLVMALHNIDAGSCWDSLISEKKIFQKSSVIGNQLIVYWRSLLCIILLAFYYDRFKKVQKTLFPLFPPNAQILYLLGHFLT